MTQTVTEPEILDWEDPDSTAPVEPLHSDETSDRYYRRWERQQWNAVDIDLSADREAWQRIPAFVRGELEATIEELGGGDVAVTRLLPRLIEHAPEESYRIYLATQLADEARHAVFFRRYRNEVFHGRGPETSSEELTDFPESAYVTEFEPVLRTAVEAVGEGDRAAWLHALSHYHLITEGVLGVTVLRMAQTIAGSRRLCPGLADGVAGILRDESRHVGFGRAVARAAVARGDGEVLAQGYLRGLAAAARVMVGPAREREELASARWRGHRAKAKQDRLDQAFERAGTQALRCRLPVTPERLRSTWDAARDEAFEEYRSRWGKAHPAEHPAEHPAVAGQD